MKLQVFASNFSKGSNGWLKIGSRLLPCALGREGITGNKREGDGCTPLGKFEILHVYYRPDRVLRPQTALAVSQLKPDYGWCDDPADSNYNRPVKLPYAASHEKLWRDDCLYDIFAVLDYNFRTVKKGKGSAIFLHVANSEFGSTEGCVALQPAHIRQVLASVQHPAFLEIF